MTPKLWKHHKTDRKLIKLITPNTGKTSCTSSDYGFMRPVCRRNNPNKKTLIYIPLFHITIIRVYTTQIAKQHKELLISTLLFLLLVLPIYLDMFHQYTYIHIWVSQSCYWKVMMNNRLYLQWVSYIHWLTHIWIYVREHHQHGY